MNHFSGLWIWRVQNFKLIAVPRNQYGKFYQGNCELKRKMNSDEFD